MTSEYWTYISTGWAAVATVFVALLRYRNTQAEARKTEVDGELGITQSWADYAKQLESRLDQMQGRLDALEKEAQYWREKHLTVKGDYTRLEVQADSMKTRITHLEEENDELRSILHANGLSASPTPKQRAVTKKTAAARKAPPKK
jgi:TolA-binding protein